jgi:L-iditol 2-dehydrogenase
MGADVAIAAESGVEVEAIKKATGGRGVDVAFEVAGAQEAVDAAVEATAPGGKVLLVGIPTEDRTSFTASTARRKGLGIKLVRRMKNAFPRAIALVAKGLIDVGSLVTHRFSLDRAQEAFLTAQRREGLKVLVAA